MKARRPSLLAVCLAILATALVIFAVHVEPAQGRYGCVDKYSHASQAGGLLFRPSFESHSRVVRILIFFNIESRF
jgi:hypothetical protein